MNLLEAIIRLCFLINRSTDLHPEENSLIFE